VERATGRIGLEPNSFGNTDSSSPPLRSAVTEPNRGTATATAARGTVENRSGRQIGRGE
jgi:hypothetical protein